MAGKYEMELSSLGNEAWNGAILAAGAVGVSMASKRLANKKLIQEDTLSQTGWLAVAIAVSAGVLKYGRTNGYLNWLPTEPFKK